MFRPVGMGSVTDVHNLGYEIRYQIHDLIENVALKEFNTHIATNSNTEGLFH